MTMKNWDTPFTDALLDWDVTELEGLDVLSEPSECLLESQQLAAELFGVQHSFYLVNGGSVGLSAGLLSLFKPGDKVLLPRNVHRSIISGLILAGLEPVWFMPPWLDAWGLWDGLTPHDIDTAWSDLDKTTQKAIKGLVIVSPTYEGLGSDTTGIANWCRKNDLKFIVDEVHGSLWPLSDRLPPSASQSKADLVVHSLHKSACSLTQSAIAHIPVGSTLNPADYQQALNTLQSTSPSYLLLASLEQTCAYLASDEGRARIDVMLDHLTRLRGRLKESLSSFELFEPPPGMFHDPGRLYLRTDRELGDIWAPWVESEYKLPYESCSAYGALYYAGLGLENDDYERFLNTLITAEQHYLSHDKRFTPEKLALDWPPIPLPETILNPREAFFAPGRRLPLAEAIGRIAKETIVHCPPGIPVIIPGERIQPQHKPYLPQNVLVIA